MANRIHCPNCQKELRTGIAVAAGAGVTCPACQTKFSAGATAATVTSGPAATWAPRRSGLIIGAGIAALALFSAAAFVWPGFLRTSGLSAVARANQEQARNLLAFAPHDSTVVVGVNFGHVRKSPDLQSVWTKLRQRLAQWTAIPPAVHDLIGDADSALLAGSGNADATPICIVSTEHAIDAVKLKQAVGAGEAQRHHGVTICPCTPIADRNASLALLTDKLTLLGLMPPEPLGRHVAAAVEPNIHPDLRAQVEQVSTSVIWGAVQFDAAFKQELRQLESKFGFVLLVIPEAKAIAQLAQRGKGAVLTLDAIADKKLKLSIGFTCHDANDAALLRTAVLNLWTAQHKNLIELAAGYFDKSGTGRLGKLLGEVSQTFDLEQRDTSVLLSIEVNQATLEELLNSGLLPGIR